MVIGDELPSSSRYTVDIFGFIGVLNQTNLMIGLDQKCCKLDKQNKQFYF